MTDQEASDWMILADYMQCPASQFGMVLFPAVTQQRLDRAQAASARLNAAAKIALGRDGSPARKVTRPDEQDAPGSSIGLGAEGEQ